MSHDTLRGGGKIWLGWGLGDSLGFTIFLGHQLDHASFCVMWKE